MLDLLTIVSIVVYVLALFFLPPLALLFFAHKNERLIWLTIPTSVLGHGIALVLVAFESDPEGLLGGLVIFIPHTVIVCIGTAVAIHIKSKTKKTPNKRTVMIAFGIYSAIVLAGLAALMVYTLAG